MHSTRKIAKSYCLLLIGILILTACSQPVVKSPAPTAAAPNPPATDMLMPPLPTWTPAPPADTPTPFMLNLDSLIAGDNTYVYGDAGSPDSLRDWILQAAQADGFEVEAKTAEDMNQVDGSPCECTDFDAFQEAGIPFAYFEATNWAFGEEDGTTQVNPKFGEAGLIRHTAYDTIEYLEATFPGRIDHHLNVFVTLLYQAVTQFK